MPEGTLQIDLDMTVGEVMKRSSATIRVFLDFGMGCPGCPIASFHTVADACREHRLEAAVFLAALRATPHFPDQPSGRVCSAISKRRWGSRSVMR